MNHSDNLKFYLFTYVRFVLLWINYYAKYHDALLTQVNIFRAYSLIDSLLISF